MELQDIVKIAPVEKAIGQLLEAKPYVINPKHPQKVAFGGATLYQALYSAYSSVDDEYLPCSCHCYFTSVPNLNLPMTFHVEKTFDGDEVASRIVKVNQGSKTLFTLQALFQNETDQCNSTESQHKMPQVTHHSQLKSLREMNFQTRVPWYEFMNDYATSYTDCKLIDENFFTDSKSSESRPNAQMVWIRLGHPSGKRKSICKCDVKVIFYVNRPSHCLRLSP